MLPSLPIDAFVPDIAKALSEHKSLVLSAPPGSGKTTRVPPALLDAPWLQGKKILILEPRRLATRAAARRMAQERGEEPGQTIGFRVRFDQCVSPQTRIEVVTEAILTRRLQTDPELSDIGLVVFDEFHERSLNSDLGLTLCLDVQSALREDLKLLLMSATLNAESLMAVLDDAVHIEAKGRSYPVDLVYLSRETTDRLEDTAISGVMRALSEQQGDLLVFLPGGGEIRRVAERLEQQLANQQVVVLPLYGDLSSSAQDQALLPDKSGRRKIVLATTIAETSLTIPGITVVVDTGRAKIPRFDPNSGLTRLQTLRISAASAIQRAGRAGRTAPGVCYRLWTETTQQGLLAHQPPEIHVADLANLALELALWGVDSFDALNWVDAPTSGAFAQAQDLLKALGLLDAHHHITALGKRLSGFGVHPRLSVMLEKSRPMGAQDLAADLAALISERDIFRGPGRPSVDIALRLEALAAFRRDGRRGARQFDADPGACSRVDRAAGQWRRMLRLPAGKPRTDPDQAGLLLAHAYPDRIAQRRPGDEARYRMSGGAGAILPPGDALAHRPWLIAGSLNAGKGTAMIQLAAEVRLEALEEAFSDRIEEQQSVHWDSRKKSVVALHERKIGAVVIDQAPWRDAPPEAIQAALMDGVRQTGLHVLSWSNDVQTWRNRVAFLREQDGEDNWPDLSDAALLANLEDWLLPWVSGVSRIEQLTRLDLGRILKSALDWSRQQKMDELAPEHLVVPSGSRVRLEYETGKPPVLPVRLQEMFGLVDTPALVQGKVPVLLHLLSPARRPIQVTQDLRGFWQRTYQDVKKELKGRYPKHYWPDDPLQAQPTARAKRRGT